MLAFRIFSTMVFSAILAAAPALAADPLLKKVLVYAKPGWYVHPDIDTINGHLKKMGADNGFQVDISVNPADFNATKLAGYQVVVLNNISEMGTAVSNAAQRNAFKTWLEGGGGLMGFHGSGVVRDTWPWFIEMLGTDWYYDAAMQEGRVFVPENVKSLPIMAGLTEARLSDEWNNFKVNVDTLAGIDVVLGIDETSYDPTKKKNQSEGNGVPGFKMADPQGRWVHPISWIRKVGNGRMFYTCIGHDIKVVGNPFTTKHFLQAIQWAAGDLQSTTGLEPALPGSEAFGVTGSRIAFGRDGAHALEVFSMQGRKVLAESGSGPAVYELASRLPPGIYRVRMTQGSRGRTVGKLAIP